MLAASHHDYASARGLHLAALDLARAVGDAPSTARALRRLGDLAEHQGNRTGRSSYFDQALATCRAHGLRSELAWTLLDIGESAILDLNFPESESRLRESVAMFEDSGDRRGAARAYFALGQLAFGQGDDDASAVYLERSRSSFTEMNYSEWIGAVGLYLGLLHVRREEYAQARSVLNDSLHSVCEVRDEHGMAQLLEGVACLEVALGDLQRAQKLFATAARTRARLNLPIDSWEHRWLDPWLNRLSAESSTGGQQLELDAAVQCALESRS
jgi:tetratricopeptide (TPR) repeat protein